MANITMTQAYSQLNDWPGHLFQIDGNATVVTRTGTSLVYRFNDTSDHFAGYRVEVTGTGFRYDGGAPIAGQMNRLRVLDDLGNPVLSYANLGKNPMVNDLSQFYASVFGTEESDGDGIGPQPDTAMSQLTLGNDVVTGTEGDDQQNLVGFDPGNDRYVMLGGDDWIVGGLGNDTIDGGDGFDIYSLTESNYILGAYAFRGATVNMQTGVVLDPWGGRDVLIGIEEVRGSRFNDSFVGNNADRDRFMGLRGRDTLDGGANSFTPEGERDEDRRDEVRYNRDARDGGRLGIVVDLETSFDGFSIKGTIRDGFGNLDTVIDIERVIGTRFNDVFVGSRMNNNFSGGEGRDSYAGEEGWDVIQFDRYHGRTEPSAGIRVDLSRSSGQVINDGFGNTENVSGIESIRGSWLNDQVKGNAEANEFSLGLGRDTMTGGGGADYFVWESLDEFGQGDRVTDFRTTGDAADILAFWTPGIEGMTTTLTLVNGTAATAAGVGTFVFNTASDTLFWDGDGAGGQAQVAIAVLTGVGSLSAANFELWT